MDKKIISTYRAILIILFCGTAFQTGCTKNESPAFQGYVEGEYLYVSSPLAGDLEQLAVSRGMQVKKGDLLFALERQFEQAAVQEAEHMLQEAENRLTDLTKGLRPSEIEEIKAGLAQSRAAYELSQTEYERNSKLFEQKVVPKEQLDRIRTELEKNRAMVEKLSARLKTAKLGARQDVIEAARSSVEAAQNRVSQARWKLEQKSRAAPVDALVYDTYYVEGEFVAAARPVVSLLAPGNIRIRFFVPEPVLSKLSPGQPVFVRLDGKEKTFRAEINYISPEAEYTPPVIYSRETRSKLVFRVEAEFSPADAASLNPGQPADVFLEAGNA